MNIFRKIKKDLETSVTRLDYFWKVLVINFLIKVAEKFRSYFGYYWKQHF